MSQPIHVEYGYSKNGITYYVCHNPNNGAIKHVAKSELIKNLHIVHINSFDVKLRGIYDIVRFDDSPVEIRNIENNSPVISNIDGDFSISNKYHMTVEQNIFVAKRNIIDYIWKSAKLEGLAVTYPDTEAIYNGSLVSGVSVDDVLTINNLKHAWRFVLETISYPIDYPFICKINQLIGEGGLIHGAGYLRTLPVTIGGTAWIPPIPDEFVVKNEISSSCLLENSTDRAITLMLYLMRKQAFIDGNKRTAMLAGNHVMIANGVGIISVPIEYQKQFTTLLIRYYETGEMVVIKKFVFDNCIDGIRFNEGG